MEIYELSQQDIHVLEEKLREDKSILKKRDNVSELAEKWKTKAARAKIIDFN